MKLAPHRRIEKNSSFISRTRCVTRARIFLQPRAHIYFAYERFPPLPLPEVGETRVNALVEDDRAIRGNDENKRPFAVPDHRCRGNFRRSRRLINALMTLLSLTILFFGLAVSVSNHPRPLCGTSASRKVGMNARRESDDLHLQLRATFTAT